MASWSGPRRPSHSEWTPGDRPPPRSIGHPEAAAIGEGPDLVNLGGVREDRIIGFLADFRAATRAHQVQAFHMSGQSVSNALKHLKDQGLITSVGRNLYITQRGVDMLAARDRVDASRLVEVTHLDPEGEAATRERRHDSAVAAVAAKLKGAGMPVVAGWRWVVSWDDGQLVPDIWVLLPVPGREDDIWLPVEVEFSAKGERRIEEKLRSYRLAPLRLNKLFPILVITGEEKPAQLFDSLARDLPLVTTTLKAFLTGIWEGPESVWRRGGLPVGLGEFAGEHSVTHLRQPTGRSLDYRNPSPGHLDGIDRRRNSFGRTPRPRNSIGNRRPWTPNSRRRMPLPRTNRCPPPSRFPLRCRQHRYPQRRLEQRPVPRTGIANDYRC